MASKEAPGVLGKIRRAQVYRALHSGTFYYNRNYWNSRLVQATIAALCSCFVLILFYYLARNVFKTDSFLQILNCTRFCRLLLNLTRILIRIKFFQNEYLIKTWRKNSRPLCRILHTITAFKLSMSRKLHYALALQSSRVDGSHFGQDFFKLAFFRVWGMWWSTAVCVEASFQLIKLSRAGMYNQLAIRRTAHFAEKKVTFTVHVKETKHFQTFEVSIFNKSQFAYSSCPQIFQFRINLVYNCY